MTSIRLLRFSARCLPFALLAAALPSCGSSNPASVKGTALTNANNYMATTHQLTIPTITAKAGTDLTLDWSGIMKDLLCHTATPIESVTFAQIPLKNKTQAQLENELATGTFNSLTELHMYWNLINIPSTTTTTMLSSLMYAKAAVNPSTDFVPMDNMAFMLAFADTSQVNQGFESMVFLQPDPNSSMTTVMAPDACAGMFLNFAATLGQPLSVPNSAPYVIDWSGLTADGFGNVPILATVNKIEVAFYQGMQPMDLQTNLKDAEQIATTLYSATDVAGATSYDLTHTKTDSGQAFTGFTPTDGTWAMALLNTAGAVPAPVAFTILQPM